MEIINKTQVKFLNEFENSYKYVKNSKLDNILKQNFEELCHINFYGPNGSFKNFYVYYLIHKITGHYFINPKKTIQKISVNNNNIEFEVIINDNYIELNPSINGFYDRWIITEYIQNIIKSKNITQKKHIIVLRDLDKLSLNSFMTLRRILEKYSCNSLFIFTSTNLSYINEAILSRCLNIRCPIETEKNMKSFLNNYFEDKLKIKQILATSNRDINKVMFIYSKLELETIYIPILYNQIKEHYQFMKKTKDVIKVLKENREFLNRILNFNYNNEEIIQCFQDILFKSMRKKRNEFFKVIGLLKNLDLELINCQKDFFAFEKFLAKLYEILLDA
jgi:DNA polymerase III delta prime subunit